MSKECWVDPAEPVQPISRAFGLVAHPLELATRPPDDIGIDPLQGRTQLRLVEVAVVDDPAADARIVHLGQFGQGLVAAKMKRPATDVAADARQRLRTGGGLETVREDAPVQLHPHDLSSSKLEAKKVKVTCNSEGADNGNGKKWTPDLNRYFKDRDVYILPDNDAPGRQHAEHVARNLDPVAKSVRIIEHTS